MKNLKLFVALLISISIVSIGYSQKIKLKTGNLSALKGQTSINVEYDYEGMGVGKYRTQEEYIEDGFKEREEKEAGTGQKFKDSWYNAQKEKYPNKFEELMNKGLEGNGMKISQNNSSAKYTLIVKTTFTEPGFNIGIMRKPAFTNIDVYVVETANKDNIIAQISSDANPGQDAMGFDYDASFRIGESYAKCGKSLAKFISKNLK